MAGPNVPRPTFRKQERMHGSGRGTRHQLGLGWPVGFFTLDDEHNVWQADEGLRGASWQHKNRGSFEGMTCLERTVQQSKITELAGSKTERNWQGCGAI